MNEALAMPTRPRAAWPWAGLATVVFLGVTAGVQMSDRGLQSILSPAIRETFGVGDAVIGALHGIAGILIASALAIRMPAIPCSAPMTASPTPNVSRIAGDRIDCSPRSLICTPAVTPRKTTVARPAQGHAARGRVGMASASFMLVGYRSATRAYQL